MSEKISLDSSAVKIKLLGGGGICCGCPGIFPIYVFRTRVLLFYPNMVLS